MAEAGPGGLPRRSPLPLLVTLGMLAGLLVGTASADERATTAALPTTETAGATEAAGADEITLELIMSDPDWIGNTAKDPYWADDGDAVYFHRKRVGEQIEDLIRLDLATGEERVIADEERGAVDSPGGRLSRDRRFRVYSRHGDLYLKNLETGTLTQLTRTAADETRPRFMADDRGISFHRGDQVYVRDLETGLEYQSADVRLEEDPDDDKPKDDFLSAQQQRLFDVLKQRKDRREAASERAESEQAADPTRPPLPFYLGEEIEIRQAALSGAGDAMILVVRDAERDPGKKDQMPAWVTDSGYVTSQEVRPKVGTGDGSGERLIYLDLEAHEHRELALSVLPGIAEDPLAELKRQTEETKKAEAASEDGENEEEPADDDEEKDAGDEKDEAADAEPEPRAVRFEEPVAWSPDGLQLAVQAHSVDNKDRWIALVDRDEKSLRPIHRLSNEAWINWIFNDFGWFSDSRRLWFLSEESGYSQLYVYSLDDGETSRLTGGDYVVSGVELSPAEDFFYFTANPTHPGVYDTYRVATGGGAVERMTRLGGRTSSILSPDGELLLVTHSITTRPPELYVQATRAGSQVRQITRHATEGFLSLPWVEPEIVAVPSTHHERPIHSRYYEGEAEAGERGRPAVVFVHGAGYLQNAHQGWSGYFREFMFHTLLTRHGYVVLDMDYRASAGYGADWRTAIYRQMGTPELEDLADGVAWLVAEHGVDPDRVGVYGGSYGGFMTMMALFTAPDLFACGAALRPVTDWAHYNHPYTSN
ncbi:MAG: S9 family peptidase, partial [bacterium]|nr:S9 family peptidase [bacterium]